MPDEIEPIDTALVTQSLQKVAKGAGLVFVGTIIGMILGFLQRVLMARHYTQEEYGVFSLAFVLFNIFAILATLGLQEGVPRQIAYYRGKKDMKKVRGIITSSIEIAVIAGIIFSLILFFGSDVFSIRVFHENKLISVLKILSIALPFFVLMNVFIAIARGFNDVKPRIYFQNILRNILFIFLLLIAISLDMSFLTAIYGLSLSIIVSCLLLAIYITKKITFLEEKNAQKTIPSIKKELLIFSFPLLVVTTLNMVMTWTDTIMLGYFKGSAIVGLYNAAFPLAQLIPMALISAGFLYVPIVSELYSKNLIKEVGRTYQILTKWIFLCTFPIFITLFLFPQVVLKNIFGIDYIAASPALRILCLGFMFHTFLGLNGLTLVIMGKTKFLMYRSVIAASLNVILNFVLIPRFDIIGAAIASSIAYGIANVINSTKLYLLSALHPFTRNYLKTILIYMIFTGLLYIFTHYFVINSLAIFILCIFMFIFPLLVLIKGFDEEDIELLRLVKRERD